MESLNVRAGEEINTRLPITNFRFPKWDQGDRQGNPGRPW